MEKPRPRRFVDNTDDRTDQEKAAVIRRVAAFNREFSADPQRAADLALAGRLYGRTVTRSKTGRSAVGVYDGDVRVIGADLIRSANGFPLPASIIAEARSRADGILNPTPTLMEIVHKGISQRWRKGCGRL